MIISKYDSLTLMVCVVFVMFYIYAYLCEKF
nr:MAG TPA: hypothetical protein [Caudoviricetes sp.]